jgi:hypothetical protein
MAWFGLAGRRRGIAAAFTSCLAGLTAGACGKAYSAADLPPAGDDGSTADAAADATDATDASIGDAGDGGACSTLLVQGFASVPGLGWTAGAANGGQVTSDPTIYATPPSSLRSSVDLSSGIGRAYVDRTVLFGSTGVGTTTLAYAIRMEAPTPSADAAQPGPLYAEVGCTGFFQNGAGEATQTTFSRWTTGELGVAVASNFPGSLPLADSTIGSVTTGWYGVRVIAATSVATISFEVTAPNGATLRQTFPATFPRDTDRIRLECGISYATLAVAADAGAGFVTYIDDLQVTRCAP